MMILEKYKLNKLKNIIEKIRIEINTQAVEKNKFDCEIIKLSQKLDKLLNLYHKLKYKNHSCLK